MLKRFGVKSLKGREEIEYIEIEESEENGSVSEDYMEFGANSKEKKRKGSSRKSSDLQI